MAEAKAEVSENISTSKAKVAVIEPVKGKLSEKATRGTLDKR